MVVILEAEDDENKLNSIIKEEKNPSFVKNLVYRDYIDNSILEHSDTLDDIDENNIIKSKKYTPEGKSMVDTSINYDSFCDTFDITSTNLNSLLITGEDSILSNNTHITGSQNDSSILSLSLLNSSKDSENIFAKRQYPSLRRRKSPPLSIDTIINKQTKISSNIDCIEAAYSVIQQKLKRLELHFSQKDVPSLLSIHQEFYVDFSIFISLVQDPFDSNVSRNRHSYSETSKSADITRLDGFISSPKSAKIENDDNVTSQLIRSLRVSLSKTVSLFSMIDEKSSIENIFNETFSKDFHDTISTIYKYSAKLIAQIRQESSKIILQPSSASVLESDRFLSRTDSLTSKVSLWQKKFVNKLNKRDSRNGALYGARISNYVNDMQTINSASGGSDEKDALAFNNLISKLEKITESMNDISSLYQQDPNNISDEDMKNSLNTIVESSQLLNSSLIDIKKSDEVTQNLITSLKNEINSLKNKNSEQNIEIELLKESIDKMKAEARYSRSNFEVNIDDSISINESPKTTKIESKSRSFSISSKESLLSIDNTSNSDGSDVNTIGSRVSRECDLPTPLTTSPSPTTIDSQKQATLIPPMLPIKRHTVKIVSKTPIKHYTEDEAAILIQKMYRRYRCVTLYRSIRVRHMVAQEILDTEKSYHSQLMTLKNDFMIPLRKFEYHSTFGGSNKVSISFKENISIIFTHIDELVFLTGVILNKLTERIEKYHIDTEIGDIFIYASKSMKIYANFVSNYEDAVEAYDKCLRVSQFEKKIYSIIKHKGLRSHSVKDILITPVQRPPRYILMLKELLKRTPFDHPDYNNIKKAIRLMEKSVSMINEKQKRTQNMKRIKSSIGFCPIDLISPHRFLRHEGKLLEVMDIETLSSTGIVRSVFLFNDIFLCSDIVPTMPKMGFAHNYRWHLHLKDIININYKDNQSREDENIDFSIHIEYKLPNGSTLERCLYARSFTEHRKWAHAFTSAHKSLTKK